MKKLFTFLFVFAFLLQIAFPMLTFASADKVYHAPLENEVEKGLSEFLQRAIKEAEAADAKAIVFEIHTPGGLVDAAQDIGKVLKEADIKTIAYVNSKALSAGAYLALMTDEIYMVPHATMGAAAVITGDGNAADDKATSAWLSQMEAAAVQGGRDPQYALAMADASIDLPQYRAGVGELLTLTAEEAVEVGYAKGVTKNLDEVLMQAGLEGAEIVNVEPTFLEQVARFITNPIVVSILLSVASLGIVLELYSPGFGVPGVMGLSALGLFFFGHTVAGLAGWETLIFFIIGVILIILEFVLPGGIVGFIGLGFVVMSILFAGDSVTHMAYSIVIAIFIALIGMVIMMKLFGKKLHVFNKLVLRDATTTDEGYVSNVTRTDLLGKEAVTQTQLRPAGVILLEGERIDAVSDGSFIEKGRTVKVVKVEGARIVVTEVQS